VRCAPSDFIATCLILDVISSIVGTALVFDFIDAHELRNEFQEVPHTHTHPHTRTAVIFDARKTTHTTHTRSKSVITHTHTHTGQENKLHKQSSALFIGIQILLAWLNGQEESKQTLPAHNSTEMRMNASSCRPFCLPSHANRVLVFFSVPAAERTVTVKLKNSTWAPLLEPGPQCFPTQQPSEIPKHVGPRF